MGNSIENKIVIISNKEIGSIKNKILEDSQLHLVELDGKQIQSYNDFIMEIEDKFKFPSSCIDNINGYLDWITDLSWLEKEGFIVIINDFNEFCRENTEERNEILEHIDEDVLPFWQDEVKDVVAGGEPKLFMVYLVE